MSKEFNKTINKLDKILDKTHDGVDEDINQLNKKLEYFEKNLIKQWLYVLVWIIATIALYWWDGTSWYFWILAVFTTIITVLMSLSKKIMARVKSKLEATEANYEILKQHQEEKDNYENDVPENDFNEPQQILEKLLNKLEVIAEQHGELYDTVCRENMSDAVIKKFVLNQQNYSLINDFGLHEEQGNQSVKNALDQYINAISIFASEQNIHQLEQRLEIFQDEDVFTNDGQSMDEFFGWLDEDDLSNYA